jgi:hypothetical protein
MKGFTWLVGPDLRWSVRRGWLEAYSVFTLVLESTGCSFYPPSLPGDEVDDAWVGSWRDYFVMSLLGGYIFPRGVVRWTG